MTVELQRMRERFNAEDVLSHADAKDSTLIAHKLLIEAACIDRRLIDNRHWQELMKETHDIMRKRYGCRVDPEEHLQSS
jgi:hypothetical protein